MLENLMEDKQLNLNRPLLSVRRGSSTSALAGVDRKNSPCTIPDLPYYKAQLKSGPVSNPATVPFKWEQIPGRAKEERKLQTKALEQLPPAPKLPPGRVVNNVEKPSRALSKYSCGTKSQQEFDGVCISDYSTVYNSAGEYQPSAYDREENGSSHSEGENSTYLDALDTLSRSESLFLNCSVSGVDEPGMQSSGTFLDPQTRDFMMGRFLPAAKAVATETPQFGSWKPPVMKEQAGESNEVLKSDMRTSRYYYTPTSLPQYLEDEREEEEEEEEGTENVSNTLCGLLPTFCQLNPIPGMRGQPPTSLPSVRKVPKKYTNSCIYDKCEKAIRDAVYERRRLTIYQKSDLRVGANDLKDGLKKHNLQSASSKLDELSWIASLESNSIVPYTSVSHHSLMSKETGFLGIPAATTHSEEVPLASPSATIEKTLYIDSTEIAEYGDSNSSSGDVRIQRVRLPDADSLQLPLPLPKCPSESWLSHALPSMSSRRPLSKSFLSAKNLTLKPSPAEPKWEALVKSSNLHNNNLGLPGVGSRSFLYLPNFNWICSASSECLYAYIFSFCVS